MKRDKEEREKQYEMVTKRRERNNESGREMCMNTFLEKKKISIGNKQFHAISRVLLFIVKILG